MTECRAPRTIHTIGHSTRSLDTFLNLLREHQIAMVVDVRRWPTSRRFPHFGREPLAQALDEQGIEYLWREDLGGYRTPSPDSANMAWRVGAFRAYADFMLPREFEEIIAQVERLAESRRLALMFAEAIPWRCHRQLLADAFLVRNWSVRHILEDRCDLHRLPPFARPEGIRIIYPQA